MQLIDTHTHIYLPEFDADRDHVVSRAVGSGVTKLLMPNIDIDSVEPMLAAESRYPGICLPMMGLHPTSVKDDFIIQLDKLEDLLKSRKFRAIGETGIDLYWDKTTLDKQVIAFKRQIVMSLDSSLPVVIHSRNSFEEVSKVLEEFRSSGIRGVFHAFTGSEKDAEKAIDFGFRLGIGGIVTFRNSGLDMIVKHAGIENIILETDSPYLAPVPYRGKRNESSYLCIINNRVSELLGISKEETAALTFKNSVELFGL